MKSKFMSINQIIKKATILDTQVVLRETTPILNIINVISTFTLLQKSKLSLQTKNIPTIIFKLF